MELFKGALLACDVDETLVTNGKTPEVNIEKIKYFKENGGKVVIATGRSYYALDNIKNCLEIFDPSVVSNGSIVYDFKNKNILLLKSFTNKDKEAAKAVLKSDSTIGIEVNTTEGLFVVNKTINTIEHIEYENITATEADFDFVFNKDWVKVAYCCFNKEQLDNMDTVLKELDFTSYFVRTTQKINGKIKYYYEQMPYKATKAESLKELLKIFNIKKGCFYAIGDYYNDYDMLKAADISACPKESPKEIKDICDYITVSADNGAVADFINYLSKKH